MFARAPSFHPSYHRAHNPGRADTEPDGAGPTAGLRFTGFRQFDFWLGHWKVTNPKGVQVATSEITRVSEGCAVREQWQSAKGQGGTSINYCDSAAQRWHQLRATDRRTNSNALSIRA